MQDQIREFTLKVWPSKEQIRHLSPYWKVRKSFSVCEGVLLFYSRIVVPKSLQWETLDNIHQGHIREYRAVSIKD